MNTELMNNEFILFICSLFTVDTIVVVKIIKVILHIKERTRSSVRRHILLYVTQVYQGRYIRRTTIFIFSFCLGLVTQLNGSALGVLKHHYITKRIRELLIGNSRFLIYNSLN